MTKNWLYGAKKSEQKKLANHLRGLADSIERKNCCYLSIDIAKFIDVTDCKYVDRGYSKFKIEFIV